MATKSFKTIESERIWYLFSFFGVKITVVYIKNTTGVGKEKKLKFNRFSAKSVVFRNVSRVRILE